MDNLNWTLIQSFLAVAETGSLTAAARRSGQSQPTLGRHIRTMEEQLGTELFTRIPSGLKLTDAGEALLEPATAMAQASAKLSMLAAGEDSDLSGTVRVTASVVVSHYVLPQIIAQITASEPNIEIELVPSDESANLLYNDADIAIRMYRPTQLDIVTRKVVDQPMALYGSHELLKQFEEPKSLKDFAKIPFVGLDRNDLLIRSMREFGFDVDRHFFSVRCDDQSTYWELVRAGCGLGGMQTAIGDRDPLVKRLDFDVSLPKLPVWLATHERLRKTPRVSRVWAFLVDGLQARMG